MIADARTLIETRSWRSATNRLYYACFYATSALLLTKGLESSKHSGVRSLFNQHFVKTGVVQKELGDIFQMMFSRRQDGDYDDSKQVSDADVLRLLPECQRFVQEIERIIST